MSFKLFCPMPQSLSTGDHSVMCFQTAVLKKKKKIHQLSISQTKAEYDIKAFIFGPIIEFGIRVLDYRSDLL